MRNPSNYFSPVILALGLALGVAGIGLAYSQLENKMEATGRKYCKNLAGKYNPGQISRIVSVNAGRRLLEMARNRGVEISGIKTIQNPDGSVNYTIFFKRPVSRFQASALEDSLRPFMCDEPYPNDPLFRFLLNQS